MANASYPDFPAACIGWLRGDAQVVAAFGEDASSPATTKFWGDHAEGSPSLPYLVYEELDESLSYETPGDDGQPGVNAEGHLDVHVYAATKLRARQLGQLVVRSLRDAPIVFEDGELIQLRPTGRRFEDCPELGVGVPAEYHHSIEFRYLISRS